MRGNAHRRDTIDFVVTWVDGGDPAWREQMLSYAPAGLTDAREERYRDWGLLRYWFRGVERFAPWVRTVHFVTWGHLPPWLDTSAPKLHIVRHEDFMPPDALPTFNSNALEVNLHRIPGLSETFVYFNDDMMLIGPVRAAEFFVDGRPRDMLALQPVIANPMNPVMSRILLNESLVLCKYFSKRRTMRAHPGRYLHPGYPPLYFAYNLLEMAFPQFTGFYTVHGASPLLRQSYRELWERESALLSRVTRTRFRSGGDVCQYLFREWAKQTGRFVPSNVQRDFQYLHLEDERRGYLDIIRHQRKKMVCVNDTSAPIDFEAVRDALTGAFESILPQKSSYEV